MRATSVISGFSVARLGSRHHSALARVAHAASSLLSYPPVGGACPGSGHLCVGKAGCASPSSYARLAARTTATPKLFGRPRQCTTSATTAAQAATANDDDSVPRPRFHFYGLDGSVASREVAIRTISDLRPQQVMLESCSQRRDLAEKTAAEGAAAAAAGAAEVLSAPGSGSAADSSPLSHADMIALVHGGLRGPDVVALVTAAGEAGAQVYMIDRPYQETQSRVARRLIFSPAELLAFVRRAASRLATRGEADVTGVVASWQAECPGAYEVIVSERESYMLVELERRSVVGADVLVFCTSEHLSGLRQALLHIGGSGTGFVRSSTPSTQGTSKIWPWLLVMLYFIFPIYGSVFITWRTVKWIWGFMSSRVHFSIPWPFGAPAVPKEVKEAEKETALSEIDLAPGKA
eukprot:TRINITY_DN44006_c0_g1_i1.p1 TRINITY_DN44006_c0_g1~~TRINITY_DN44006_c0_g1_i1.p1  ORF type:complete len:407 (-),score=50.76 TRINITY_DN44006_c0_g1_i1:117-1337(-)